MCAEAKFSWEFLKNVADTLDSYRIRAFIDAKKDILEAGIYSEAEYNNILIKMFDYEKLKFSLYNLLKKSEKNSWETLIQFSQKHSIQIRDAYALLELLINEKLVAAEEIYEDMEINENDIKKLILKDISIEVPKNTPLDSIKSIYEPVYKPIMNSEICSGCGICAGICPVNCIVINNGVGKIDDDVCIRCGLCYFVCPRSYLPTKLLNMTQNDTSEIKDYGKIGPFIEAYSARTTVDEIRAVCQDGGVSSTCLHYLFENGKIDYALGAKMNDTSLWCPEPILLKNKEDIISTAGTKYVNNPTLSLLNKEELKDKRLAIVGVPCMMQALLKSQIYNLGIPSLNNTEFRIGIFCMESFSYEGFLKICEKLDVPIANVKKTDINKGKFFIYTNNGEEFNIPIKEISNLAREDCEICFDLTSESADISVGSIGSPSGWNTVIIRTEKGKNLYNELLAKGLIESKPIEDVKPGLSLLQKIAGIKRNVCNKHIDAKRAENKNFPKY